MKHNIKITAIILAMFLITQFIGLYVVGFYSPVKIIKTENGTSIPTDVSAPSLPYGMTSPEVKEEVDFYVLLPSIIIAFIIAISLLFFLSKFKAEFFLRLWFFVVVAIALGISFNSFLPKLAYASIIALIIALPLAFVKIYKKSFIVHNTTELFIYPGIAAVFVPILNIWTVIALLILISIYDMWAVWHSGFMQKMAKYQINKLKIFSGFFIPYMSKKVKMQMMKMKDSKKKRKIKVNVAILGGGDVVFPIIAAGVMLKTLGLYSAIFVIIGATIGLGSLILLSEKKKFYPAMPFITAGIFLGMAVGYLLR
ncbi:MAG: presenilin family intramembrane aspartyl protease [archaeon]|nr:presenilin family intramembrane aspartyl protease [archaeon]